MSVKVWFNPRCGTARNVVAWLTDKGIAHEVREYLKEPPSRAEIEDVLKKSGMTAHELLRAKEALAEELGLRDPAVSQDTILSAMVDNPILINRPVVIDGERAALCRPSETVAAFFSS